MAHAYHERLPGFHPDQLLHDGCAECEERGRNAGVAISHLDGDRFVAAWERAARFLRSGLPTVSNAELPTLEALAAVQVQLERRGLPLGRIPEAVS